MNSRQDDLDAAVAAADPYPQAQVDDLAVEEAGRDLMETIMTNTQPPRRTRLNDRPVTEGPRRTRILMPLLAAAAVTAIVAGGFALRGIDGDSPTPEAGPEGTPASGPQGGPTADPTTAPQTKPKKSLPPTGDNLHHVLGADAWRVDSLDDDARWGGSLSWSTGAGENYVSMTWYPAEDYQDYLADRKEIGPVEEIELLGQTAKVFTYSDEANQPPSMGEPLAPTPEGGDADSPTETDQESPAGEDADSMTESDEGAVGSRVMVMLPPVDGWFLEFDVTGDDEAAVEAALAELHRVTPEQWEAGLGDGTVKPADADEFLAEVAKDVPMPDGVEVTAEDLDLPQSIYHARIAFLQPVVCGWAEAYVGGDSAALDVLKGSKDWPAVKALAPEGGYPGALADSVRDLAKDRDLDREYERAPLRVAV